MYSSTGFMHAGNVMDLNFFIFSCSYFFTPLCVQAALFTVSGEKERTLARIKSRHVLCSYPEKHKFVILVEGFRRWENRLWENRIELRKCKTNSVTFTLRLNLFVSFQALCIPFELMCM